MVGILGFLVRYFGTGLRENTDAKSSCTVNVKNNAAFLDFTYTSRQSLAKKNSDFLWGKVCSQRYKTATEVKAFLHNKLVR